MPIRAIPPLPALKQLSQPELRSLWHKAFGVSPPAHAQRDLLVCCLVYRHQEMASGGIRITIRRQLSKLAQDLAAGSAPDLLDTSRIKSGTRLVREWQGKTHEVIAVEDGFRYRDKPYKSLSVIARVITGTRWSGPVFFGVKRPSGSTKASRSE